MRPGRTPEPGLEARRRVAGHGDSLASDRADGAHPRARWTSRLRADASPDRAWPLAGPSCQQDVDAVGCQGHDAPGLDAGDDGPRTARERRKAWNASGSWASGRWAARWRPTCERPVFPVTVWNRTPGRAGDLVTARRDRGRRRRADLARALDVVDGLRLRHARMSKPSSSARTASPRAGRGRPRHRLLDDLAVATRGFAERLAKQGVGYVDAPVSGGSEGAKKATLTIFCRRHAMPTSSAPDRSSAASARRSPTSARSGSGQAAKAVNQVILAGTYLGVAEGIVLAMKAGLDLGASSSRRSVAAPPAAGSSQNRSGRMIAQRLPAGLQGLAPPEGPRASRLELARELGVDAAGRRRSPRNSRPGSSPGATATTTCRAVARAIRALSALDG